MERIQCRFAENILIIGVSGYFSVTFTIANKKQLKILVNTNTGIFFFVISTYYFLFLRRFVCTPLSVGFGVFVFFLAIKRRRWQKTQQTKKSRFSRRPYAFIYSILLTESM